MRTEQEILTVAKVIKDVASEADTTGYMLTIVDVLEWTTGARNDFARLAQTLTETEGAESK